MDDIRALTRGLRRADESSWRNFHESYYDLLEGVARARGVDPAEVPDVIQRSYLRMLRNAKTFDRESDFRAWVCCVLRSEVIDTARGRARRAGMLERVREWISGKPDAGHAGALLEGMPAAERRLLERHYTEGWSQAELAAEAGVSVKAMESRLARLRIRARQWLVNQEEISR
ncbi:RNA polymerase sigma factor [Haloferula sp. A504]|uniref:RNA polymerase sigma factor n=1 Tax=Haloferula sp. A504 TaxID=3373601 RepID=UPI0031BCA2E9|nr:sigma-70 family RNA polymerase sigma factor [Verrucomicrobiaceae bacterium E54]